MQLGTSANLNLRSYLWQPWFATLAAGVTLSQVKTYAAQNSSATLTSGEGRFQLFPRSRFPFTAFASVTDSRSQLESTFVEDREVRRTRFGVLQQFRPRSANANYTARIERSIENGTADSLNEVSDLVDLTASHGFRNHNIESTINFQRTRQDDPALRFRDFVATVRHSYRPSTSFSLENFASLTDTVSDSPNLDLHTTSTSLSSFGIWRAPQRPLTVTGNARFNSNSTSASGTSNSSYNTNANLSANYDVTRALRVSGSVSANFTPSSALATGQSLTLSYSPDSFPLLGADYSWFTSASANNSTGESASRGISTAIGHGLSRAIPLGNSGMYTLSGNINESLSTNFDTTSGSLYTINHGAAVALARSSTVSTTRARLSLQDSHTLASGGEFSGGDGFVQSAVFQLSYDARFGRYASAGSTLVLSYTRQGFDDDTSSFPSSSLGLNYRHARLFGLNRLRFQSQLSLSTDSLNFLGSGDDGRRDISWNNRLDYSIGRVDARLSGVVTDSNGRLNTVIFFTLTRRIGGVF